MKKTIAILFLIVVAASMYFLTLRGQYGNVADVRAAGKLTSVGQPFESSHERSPFAMLVAMTNKRISLTEEWANFASPDVGYINQKFYSFFPAGVPALIYPLYSYASHYNAGLLGAFATIALVSVLNLVLLYLIAKDIFKLPSWAALTAALVFGFASTSWSYAITIYQHAPTVACVLVGFYAAWRYGASKGFAWLWAIFVGGAYGVAMFIDYPNALLMAPIMVYLILQAIQIKDKKGEWAIRLRVSVLCGLIMFGVITLGHLYYNKQVFGSPLQFHNPAPRYTPETFEKLKEQLSQKNITSKPSTAVSIFSEQSLMHGLYELFIAPDKGIFFFSPIFIFALWGLIKLRKKFTLEHTIFISIALVNIFMYASFGDPWGGWAFGPRYLIPTMAVLSIFAMIPLVQGGWIFVKKLWVMALVAYSAAISTVGVVTTNLVPPKVEADYLHLKYNFLRNIDFLKTNTTGDFVYNTYAKDSLTLMQYASILYGIIMVVFFVLLFVVPLFEKRTPEANSPEQEAHV